MQLKALLPLFVVFALGCGKTTQDDGNDGASDGEGAASDPCAAFSIDECDSHEGCRTFTGQRIDWLAYCVERGTPEPLGCMSKPCRKDERIGEDAAGDDWLIPSGCIPGGWEEIALAPPPLCVVPREPAHEYCLFYMSDDPEGVGREGGSVSELEARAICEACADSVVGCSENRRCWGAHCILDGGCHCSEGAYCIAETLMEVSPDDYPYPYGSLCPIRGEGGASGND